MTYLLECPRCRERWASRAHEEYENGHCMGAELDEPFCPLCGEYDDPPELAKFDGVTGPRTLELDLSELGLREQFISRGLHRVWRARHEETASVAGKLMYPSLRYSLPTLIPTAGFSVELFQWLRTCGLDWPKLHDTNSPLIAALLPVAQRTPFNGTISLARPTLAPHPETPPQFSPMP